MIYNNTYFNEQLKKTYIEGKKGEIALAFCVVIIALVTLVIHNFFNTLRETVVGTVVPHLTKYTIFSMMSVYNVVIIVFFVALCIIKYKRITIAEISTNKWYLMIKTGHSPRRLVLAKLSANVLSVVFIYSLAFIVLIFLGSLLNLEMHINSIFSLAILGLVQVFFVVELIMGISLFVQNRGNCLFFVILGILGMYFLSYVTGFDVVAKSYVKMQDTSYLFTKFTSLYIYGLLAISFAMLFLGGFKGYHLANTYKPKAKLGANVYSISYLDDNTKFIKYSTKSKSTLFKIVTQGLLVVIVCISILANIGIIMLATLNNANAAMGDHVMMVFESETMTGKISKNDFVVFEKALPNENFKVGNVVLYYDNHKTIVQRIDRIDEEGKYVVDYMKYPHGVKPDSHSKNLTSAEIYGKLTIKSGWLGALLVWNKTIFAKILTTILPTLILIFYDKLEKAFRFIKSTAGIDEEDENIEVKEQDHILFVKTESEQTESDSSTDEKQQT